MSRLITMPSGRQVDPFHLRPEDVDIRDIAKTLSQMCRWGARSREFFSVADHSVEVHDLLLAAPPEKRMRALLHDSGEAYLWDAARHMKDSIFFARRETGLLSPFQVVENDILAAIAAGLGLQEALGTIYGDEDVIWADNVMLVTEARDFMHGTDGWDPAFVATLPNPMSRPIQSRAMATAHMDFLNLYYALTVELGVRDESTWRR